MGTCGLAYGLDAGVPAGDVIYGGIISEDDESAAVVCAAVFFGRMPDGPGFGLFGDGCAFVVDRIDLDGCGSGLCPIAPPVRFAAN